MDIFADVEMETVLSGESDWVGPEIAETLSRHPLESIDTEYPHHARSVNSPDGNPRPKEQHPVFYGCFDWHSAVHSHWALIRQLRLFDDHPKEAEIVRSIDARVTTEHVTGEVEYFEEHESFEKPYGWAWLLHLMTELRLWDTDRAAEWQSILEPLEAQIIHLVKSDFLNQDRPFRVGTHGNSAFALHCLLDYARTTGNDSLEAGVVETATDFFATDSEYPVEYEPLGWDFLSPALTEADLMRRVFDHGEFTTWLETFFPNLHEPPYNGILEPAKVDADSEEGVALHLVGLNVSKAWCLAGLADDLEGHDYADRFEQSAEKHARRGIDQAFTDKYAGSHWLSSFVLYLLSRNEGGIAPAVR